MFGIFTTQQHAKEFQIQLEKEIYFPSEVIKGRLIMETTTDLKCKGIRITLQGKGFSHVIRGSGDDKKDYFNTKYYAYCKHTIWGGLHKTPVLNEAGTNAFYGPPWAPDEGVMNIPIPMGEHRIIVRVMDYDWCKKDDLLGEVCVEIDSIIGRGQVEIPLTRNGHPEKGTINLSAAWNTDPTISEWVSIFDQNIKSS